MSAAVLFFRLARAMAFAVVCLGLSVAAHVFGGGAVPAERAVAGLILAFAIAMPATRRERTAAVILPLLGGAQLALHLLFTTGSAAAPLEAVQPSHSCVEPVFGMLIVHGWAMVVTALWLAKGEALLWGLLRQLGTRLIRLIVGRSKRLFIEPFPTLDLPELGVLRSALLRYTASRRGPPAFPRVVPG